MQSCNVFKAFKVDAKAELTAKFDADRDLFNHTCRHVVDERRGANSIEAPCRDENGLVKGHVALQFFTPAYKLLLQLLVEPEADLESCLISDICRLEYALIHLHYTVRLLCKLLLGNCQNLYKR